ncbi:TetR/AcrR family transcriptional regulator [Nocardia jiangxiensis]|uniref:TetR/AcrR family transcriptional regulator n=1 Tax=Nocardia jiangxiensis TaxID=282685 RepID=A0ABW6RYU3_9NOCA
MEQKQTAPGRRRRVQATHREMTRTLLTDAAITVFAEKGYAQSTIDQIAAEAGTSRATFYLHFRTKADLLRDLLERASGAFTEPYTRLAASLRAHDPDAVREWILEAMRGWIEVEDIMRPVYEAANASAETYRDIFPDDLPGIAEMSEALLEADIVANAEQAEIYTIILYSPLLHLFRKHLRGEPFDHEFAASAIANAWTDTIVGALHAR